MSCRRHGVPLRPISPSRTDELFCHPLFLTQYAGPTAPLVVPEYFFSDDVAFDEWADVEDPAYYLFPSFGQVLFDYVSDPATQLGDRPFINYYLAHQVAWFIPAGADVKRLVEYPDSILKLCWRWEEVLAMLFNPQRAERVRRPKIAQSPPQGYSQDERIVAYFERFARMAGIWKRENQGH